MGGFYCCSSRGPALISTPQYRYRPRTSEEHVPLSSHHDVASSLSTGLLVDTNLDTSIINTYRPPPPPMPYNVDLEHPHTPQSTREICRDKNDATIQTTNSDSVEETDGGNSLESTKCEELKESDCIAEIDLQLASEKKQEVELSKSGEPISLSLEEDDVCPICLEEYDAENPKLTTKCDHHFHLTCILEWMERSDTCPVCDQETIFALPLMGSLQLLLQS